MFTPNTRRRTFLVASSATLCRWPARAAPVAAASFATMQTIHLFDRTRPAEGWGPMSLILGSDGLLYGENAYGGLPAGGMPEKRPGTLFRLRRNGAHYQVIYRFREPGSGKTPAFLADGSLAAYRRRSGAGYVWRLDTERRYAPSPLPRHPPELGLFGGPMTAGADGNGYFVSYRRPADFYGAVVRYAPDGTLSMLHAFSQAGGEVPDGHLVRGRDGFLYGTTSGDLPRADRVQTRFGQVFRLGVDGSYAVVHEFAGPWCNPGGLTQGADGALYGTIGDGIADQNVSRRSVFRMTTDGVLTHVYEPPTAVGFDIDTPLAAAPDGSIYGFGHAVVGLQDHQLFRVTPDGHFSFRLETGLVSRTVAYDTRPVIDDQGRIYAIQRLGDGRILVFEDPPG